MGAAPFCSAIPAGHCIRARFSARDGRRADRAEFHPAQNRDDHSERAVQLAACGAFILSERTGEQVKLFAEDREAAYFGSPVELVAKVRHYLDCDAKRASIAAAGRERVVTSSHTCRDRLLQILSIVAEDPRRKSTGVRGSATA